ncbi:tripartite tricarboxylate transporter TctB family protein [Rhodosalinus sp. K401]|uniref:tripartite tricarboxylate transporter TctB family protein n=1 Tax=Rhodosalinus sp. K401 TaxID=3239195 RepID=UPI00352576F1
MQKDLESLVGGGAVLGISALLFTQVLPGQFSGVELARNPMTFPRFLLLLFAMGGAALALRGLFCGAQDRSEVPRVAWGRVFAILVLASCYFGAFAPVGFIPATLLFLPLSILVLGYRKPTVIAAVTLVAVVGLWYAFAEIFSIRPPGIGMEELLRMWGGAG